MHTYCSFASLSLAQSGLDAASYVVSNILHPAAKPFKITVVVDVLKDLPQTFAQPLRCLCPRPYWPHLQIKDLLGDGDFWFLQNVFGLYQRG